MELKLIRDKYTERATGGELIEVGKPGRICYTLEDTRRTPGIKVQGSTAIPAGRYKCDVTRSNRFGRDMVILYNCANGCEVRGEGISFTGIRMHGGNKHVDTSGCILTAYNRITDDVIQGTAEHEITELVRKAIHFGDEVWIEILD